MALFGSRTPLHSAVSILDTIMASGQVENNDGAVIIELKDHNKTVDTGTIYYRDGLVYAVHVESQPIPIGRRIATGKEVDQQELDSIIRQCKGDDTNPDIIRKILVNHLLSERTLDSYVKDHFLENISAILSWETCSGTWHPHMATKDFTMPNLSFSQLKSVVADRNRKRDLFVKELSPYFREDEIEDIAPRRVRENANEFSPEVQSIMLLSNGENTFRDIARQTGIGYAVVTQTIRALWEKGEVSMSSLSNPNAPEVTYDNARVLSESTQKPEIEEIDIAPIPVIEVEDTEEQREKDQHAAEEAMDTDYTIDHETAEEREPVANSHDNQPPTVLEDSDNHPAEDVAEQTKATSNPSANLETLLESLGALRAESQSVSAEIDQANEKYYEATTRTADLATDSEHAQRVAEELEAECNRLRDEYEAVSAKLTEQYATMERVAEEYSEASIQENQALEAKRSLEVKQDKIMDDIESVTRSFSVR